MVPFDLAVVIPLHGGAAYVERSPGLGDELGFIPVDPSTLQAKARPNVFALGDATDVPTSKAGSVAHFEGDVLAGNLRRFLAGQEPLAGFDGHTNCFIETGFGKALLIDFNYDTEPLAFQQFYWHSLLPGRDVPGISSTMPARGKTHPRAQATAGAGGHR